ncbi:MAG: B12-binding domain-containing protein [Planctomycetaceae bacterium]
MSKLISPKQFARAIDVSESTVKRWVDNGSIHAVKTAGGHRRLSVDVALRFARDHGHQLVRPETIGLPTVTQRTPNAITQERTALIESLVSGNEEASRQIILDLYLARHSLAVICDEVVAPAFCEIGNRWACGEVEVYMERRACELCLRLLHNIRDLVPSPGPEAPVALGCTLDGDPYTLAACMASLVLRDAGWNASSLGNMLPFTTIRRAIERERPKLVWLSVSTIRTQDRFVDEMNETVDLALQHGTAIAIGGRGLTPPLREKLRYSAFCETFQQLTTTAASLAPTSRR